MPAFKRQPAPETNPAPEPEPPQLVALERSIAAAEAELGRIPHSDELHRVVADALAALEAVRDQRREVQTLDDALAVYDREEAARRVVAAAELRMEVIEGRREEITSTLARLREDYRQADARADRLRARIREEARWVPARAHSILDSGRINGRACTVDYATELASERMREMERELVALVGLEAAGAAA